MSDLQPSPPLDDRDARQLDSRQPRKSRVWSDLNLNGPVPARIRPAIGEWGPIGLPSTKSKKRWRWLVPILFVVALCVVTAVGYFFFLMFR